MIKRLFTKVYRVFRSKLYTPQELICKYGGKIGKAVFIGQDVMIDYDYAFLLEVGDGAVISARCVIEFHDSCLPNVLGKGKSKIGMVEIGKRAYVGVNSVILPGVHIGEGAIVGAASLVNRDIPAGEVWGGVPARKICRVPELVERRKSTKNSAVAHFDWIGELEKVVTNYPELKKEFVNRVREHFEKKI